MSFESRNAQSLMSGDNLFNVYLWLAFSGPIGPAEERARRLHFGADRQKAESKTTALFGQGVEQVSVGSISVSSTVLNKILVAASFDGNSAKNEQ